MNGARLMLPSVSPSRLFTLTVVTEEPTNRRPKVFKVVFDDDDDDDDEDEEERSSNSNE